MPETNVQIGNYCSGNLRIEPTAINAEGGPFFPRLKIPISIDVNAMQGNSLVSLTTEASLYVKDRLGKVADATPMLLPQAIRGTSSVRPILEFALDPFRVRGLEGLRHGDMHLRLDVVMIALILARTQGSQSQIEVFTGIDRSFAQLYVDIPQSHWVDKILPAVGSSNYFLVEIPARSKYVGSAWSLIEKAEHAFVRWDTKAVFAHCREAGVALTALIERHHSGDDFLRAERWGRAIKEFNHYASLDLHLEDKRASRDYASDRVLVEKMDAECLLLITKVLAKYAEELIDDGPT